MFFQQSVSELVVAWASIRLADSWLGETVTVVFHLECAMNTQILERMTTQFYSISHNSSQFYDSYFYSILEKEFG